MTSPSHLSSILIIEPNLDLKKPYCFIDQKIFFISRVNNTLLAVEELQKQNFDLVFLSCSFSSKKFLNFLEFLKSSNQLKITPLVLVIDLNQAYSIVPGLSWNNQLVILNSLSSKKELQINLDKLL